MNIDSLVRHFGRIGATLEINERPIVPRARIAASNGYSIDVRNEGKKEFYLLEFDPKAADDLDFQVLNLRQDLRHLVLMAKRFDQEQSQKEKFLCGHDERHWFVAGLRADAAVTDVGSAMESLKPRVAAAFQRINGVKKKDWNKRHNAGFIRQGEWFFLPRPQFQASNADFVLKDEPLSRGAGSKPHTVSEMIRSRGERVYWNRRTNQTMSVNQYERLVKTGKMKRSTDWQIQVMVTSVMVRGKVRHADHATIVLPFWHEVVMASEQNTASNRFLD
jgi:hypothetical protein